jgi:copper chaperone CopZ
MKKSNLRNILLPLFTMLLISVLIAGCGKKESDEASENTKKRESSAENTGTPHSNDMTSSADNEHIEVIVSTIQCGTCKENIETAVKKLDGIESINVDKTQKVAHINYDKSKVDQAKIEFTITAAGYDANDKEADPEAYANLDDCCKLPKDQKEKKQ